TEFSQYIWNDPQSRYIAAASGVLELGVYAIARHHMKANVASWYRVLDAVRDLEIEKVDGHWRNREFDLVKDGAKKAERTSFKRLYVDWLSGQRDLARAIARLEKSDREAWLQSDRVDARTRQMVMEMTAKVGVGADTPADATAAARGKVLDLATAHRNDVGNYENLRTAVTQERVVAIVKAATGKEIPVPKSAGDLFRQAEGELLNLPLGEGKGIALPSTPGARSLQVELTLQAVKNVRSTAERSILNGQKLWRRASLPVLLIAIPLSSIAISRVYDNYFAQEMRLQVGDGARKAARDRYTNEMISSLPKPLLAMVITTWNENPHLKLYACPVKSEINPEIHNPDVDLVGSYAMLSILELAAQGKSMTRTSGGQPVLTEEFLESFFEKLITYAKKRNPALNRIPAEAWNRKILPDLMDAGNKNFGAIPKVIKVAPRQAKEDLPDFEFQKAD
ncbi:MAG: hypothetical protein HYR96_11545, partial [Deltaproteobacteria bacterium]|nr:hypothetical protein [Deltaproteobacteria bacterium]